jgi:hypothetical protein
MIDRRKELTFERLLMITLNFAGSGDGVLTDIPRKFSPD